MTRFLANTCKQNRAFLRTVYIFVAMATAQMTAKLSKKEVCVVNLRLAIKLGKKLTKIKTSTT